jgi:enamine deaminase RidA (YjgF/YER057c/UK114 family)
MAENVEAGTVEANLAALGLTLPQAVAPVANYVPTVLAGTLLHVSGQLPMQAGKPTVVGTLGAGVTVEDANAGARLCALHVLAQVKAAIGDLAKVKRVVKVVGFVASAPSFGDQPKVVNGASDLFVAALGERGRHARSAVGVAALPFGAAVEVEAIFEIG